MTPDVLAPLVRIALRYVAGALVAKGLNLDPADPDVVSLICWVLAIGFGVISESWYVLAKKMGWAR
jgi:hypothetical protein